MKQFMILHFGFERPGPDEMAAWNAWFARIEACQVEKAHLPVGRQVSSAGEITELPMGPDSITGFTVIEAEDLDQAFEIARACPIVASTRVYELMRG